MKTFKTITKEEQVADVTTCNKCGNVCDPHDWKSTWSLGVSIKADGGYDSKHLTDYTTYEFDLCEECLVKIMDGLKIPPVVIGDGETIEYSEERKRREDQIAVCYFRDVAYKNAITRGVCPWTLHGEDKICGRMVTGGTIDDVPTCNICLRDDDHSPGIMCREGVATTLEQRREIGLRYLEQVRSNLQPMPVGPHDLSIFISTAIALLIADTVVASNELYRLASLPTWASSYGSLNVNLNVNSNWIHIRIPASFPTDEKGLLQAKIANNWLIWAEEAGYRNAAASVMLGDSPEQYWNYYTR